MHEKFKGVIAAMLLLTGCNVAHKGETMSHKGRERWAAYYNNTLPAEHFKGYELVVFDRLYHPDFEILKGKTTVLAYISAGEVHGDSPDVKQMEGEGLLLRDNAHWKSHAVEMRSPIWQKIILSQVKDAKDRGFDGVMLDTIESPIAAIRALEKPDMQAAAINLIRSIRKEYPDMKIMVNRAFDVAAGTAEIIDYVLAESTYSDTELTQKSSRLLPESAYRASVDKLQQMKRKAPHLRVYTLDYWNIDDTKGVHSIYRQQRAAGFIPYVTTPDLQKHTPEPVLGRSQHRYEDRHA